MSVGEFIGFDGIRIRLLFFFVFHWYSFALQRRVQSVAGPGSPVQWEGVNGGEETNERGAHFSFIHSFILSFFLSFFLFLLVLAYAPPPGPARNEFPWGIHLFSTSISGFGGNGKSIDQLIPFVSARSSLIRGKDRTDFDLGFYFFFCS